MIRQLLLLSLAALAFLWWIARFLRGTVRPVRRDRASSSMSDGGVMVRDRVCNTFLPRSRALSLKSGSEEHFFCSERCRDVFLGCSARPGSAG